MPVKAGNVRKNAGGRVKYHSQVYMTQKTRNFSGLNDATAVGSDRRAWS